MTDLSNGGHVLASRYQLVKELGRGGMRAVWCAREDEGPRERFYQEAAGALLPVLVLHPTGASLEGRF